MLSFSKVILFVFIIISLPILLSIFDNINKIINILRYKNYVSDKMIDLSKKEFQDFAVEFFERSYKYKIKTDKEDVYLHSGESQRLLYCNNESCENFTLDDARKLIGLCESKGVKDVFIFTTKILTDQVIKYFQHVSNTYSIKYIHGKDLSMNYKEFIYKYYDVHNDTNIASGI